MSKQPEALRLADALENDLDQYDGLSLPKSSQSIADKAAAELRRIHAVNGELLEALESIAGMYDYEASACDLASRLYEARCIANTIITKAEAA